MLECSINFTAYTIAPSLQRSTFLHRFRSCERQCWSIHGSGILNLSVIVGHLKGTATELRQERKHDGGDDRPVPEHILLNSKLFCFHK